MLASASTEAPACPEACPSADAASPPSAFALATGLGLRLGLRLLRRRLDGLRVAARLALGATRLGGLLVRGDGVVSLEARARLTRGARPADAAFVASAATSNAPVAAASVPATADST